MTRRLDVVIRGYDRLQVDRLLNRLGREIATLRADRDAAEARADTAVKDLASAQAAAESLTHAAQASGDHGLQSVGVRISKMLELAKQEAAEICQLAREDAREQADSIRRLATNQQARSRLEVEATARKCSEMRVKAQAQARQVIDDAHDAARRELSRHRELPAPSDDGHRSGPLSVLDREDILAYRNLKRRGFR